jgi:ribosomal-protein-alanine N-acetyltransferase
MLKLHEDKTLFTDRLSIEPLLEKHADHLFKTLQDPNIYKFIPEKPPVSKLELKKRYRQLAKRKSPSQNEIWLNWALKLIAKKEYIGTIQATIYEDNSANIAYVIASKYWHQGLAYEACKQLLKLLVTDYKIKKVKAEVDRDNLKSQRLLEKMGFRKITVNNKGDNKDIYYELKSGNWKE